MVVSRFPEPYAVRHHQRLGASRRRASRPPVLSSLSPFTPLDIFYYPILVNYIPFRSRLWEGMNMWWEDPFHQKADGSFLKFIRPFPSSLRSTARTPPASRAPTMKGTLSLSYFYLKFPLYLRLISNHALSTPFPSCLCVYPLSFAPPFDVSAF